MGEIARNNQFLLFPQCFKKFCTKDMKKQGLAWEKLNRWSETDQVMVCTNEMTEKILSKMGSVVRK